LSERSDQNRKYLIQNEDNMPEIKDIHRFPSLFSRTLQDKKTVSSRLGRKIISEKLRQVGDVAPNGQPIEFTRVLLLKKGDIVPEAFRTLEGIKVDPRGRLSESYTDAWSQSHWNQSGDWSNSWGDAWDNSVSMGRLLKSQIVIDSLVGKVKAFSLDEFSAAELKTLGQFQIRR
jgi:hypothetical protein